MLHNLVFLVIIALLPNLDLSPKAPKQTETTQTHVKIACATPDHMLAVLNAAKAPEKDAFEKLLGEMIAYEICVVLPEKADIKVFAIEPVYQDHEHNVTITLVNVYIKSRPNSPMYSAFALSSILSELEKKKKDCASEPIRFDR